MAKRALLILGSSDLEKDRILEYLDQDTIIIGVDSGCDLLYEYSIKPDYIIGDFDSIDSKVLEYYQKLKIDIKILNKDKNLTDGEAAVLLAKELGCDEIYLGSTLKSEETDQLIGNMLLLTKYVGLLLFNNKEIISLLDKGSCKLTKGDGEVFSIIPLEKCWLMISGSAYDGEFQVSLGDTKTMRNQIVAENVLINLKEGRFIIIQRKE